jgi:hypothetical protein
MNSFFAPIYEVFYYSSPFSDDVYNFELYIPIALTLLILTIICVVLFYYVIGRPKFSRWYHWGSVLITNAIVQFFVPLTVIQNKFDKEGISEYTSEYYNFSFANMFMSVLLFIIVSFMIRWWSPDCRKTPFPN